MLSNGATPCTTTRKRLATIGPGSRRAVSGRKESNVLVDNDGAPSGAQGQSAVSVTDYVDPAIRCFDKPRTVHDTGCHPPVAQRHAVDKPLPTVGGQPIGSLPHESSIGDSILSHGLAGRSTLAAAIASSCHVAPPVVSMTGRRPYRSACSLDHDVGSGRDRGTNLRRNRRRATSCNRYGHR